MQYTTSRLIAVIVAATVAASLFTGIVPAAVAGQSSPADPAFYNGNVVTDNGDAPVGTTIEVIADDGSTSGSITIQEAGEYGGGDNPTRSDERLQLPAPDGGSGTGVTFEVTPPGGDTTTATTTPSDVTFQPADVRQVDLNAGATSGIDSLSVSFGTDPIQPGESTSVTVTGTFTNGTESDVTDQTEITSDSDLITISGNTITADSDIDQATSAVIDFNYEGATTTESITIDPAAGDDDDDGDDGTTGGGGGGGAGGAPTPDGEDEPPSVQDVRDTLNLVDTVTETSTDITDTDPDTPGTTVQVEETQSVREINFNNEELTGTVDVTEYDQDQTQEVSEQIAESVTSQVENVRLHTDGTLDDSRTVQPEPSEVNVVSVSDITVNSDSDDTDEDSSATVTLTVDRDRVNNPQNLVVVKEGFDFDAQADRWEQLETTVQEENEQEVTVQAQVPDFSLFAVAEVTPEDDEPAQVDDGNVTDDGEAPEDEDEDDGPNAVIIVLLLFIAALAAVIVYQQQNTDGNLLGGGEGGNGGGDE